MLTPILILILLIKVIPWLVRVSRDAIRLSRQK